MSGVKPDLRNGLLGALGYLMGAISGVLLIVLLASMGIGSWLIHFIPEDQTLLKVLAVPLIAVLLLFMGGALIGGSGGWVLAGITSAPRKARLVTGSGIAVGISVSLLTLLFLLLTSFIALYNNLTTNSISQYLLIFSLYGLIFGLLTGIILAFTTVRLKYTWRVILASVAGFTLGGLIAGLLVRLVNPTAGFQTYPWLTWMTLCVALAAPFIFGGGALGYIYGRLKSRADRAGQTYSSVEPSPWQTGIVAFIAIAASIWATSLLGDISSFLTIKPANEQTQLTSKTVGVAWSEPFPYTPDLGENNPYDSDTPMTSVGADDVIHTAWCDEGGVINYQRGDSPPEHIEYPQCSASPGITLDTDGRPHLVWYTTEIRDTNGSPREVSALVESIRVDTGWSEPAIVAHTAQPVHVPNLSTNQAGELILSWEVESEGRFSTLQMPYSCDKEELSDLEQSGLASILEGGFRQSGSQIAYCQNEFRRIAYTPNPDPAYSTSPTTPNGAFDDIALVIDTAEYEVLFTTMQYEPSTARPSPGNVLADGVARLYNLVKANPERYPRGMTVRIMLGNYPVVSNLSWGDQIYAAIEDIRAAGVEKMVYPEIGWRLEIANFPGVYPHSHTKFLVLDGRLVTSAGFNYGYLHFPKDHPSGKGFDLFDLGLSVNGPIGQDALSVYDDMWEGADQVYCSDFSPTDGSDWHETCQELTAVADHVPEVLRYTLPDEVDSNTFSLYRNNVYKEADEFIGASLSSVQQSIDAISVNFSLELICMANLVFPDLCTIENALPWMNAMLEAIQANGVKVRVIMENTNSNGLENRVAGTVLMEELERLGLSHLVELRFYNGKLHAKSMLLDGKLLIIGSQNLHYSSWGEAGLNEYSLSTDNPQAISEYQTMFEEKWAQAIRFEEAKYGTSP